MPAVRHGAPHAGSKGRPPWIGEWQAKLDDVGAGGGQARRISATRRFRITGHDIGHEARRGPSRFRRRTGRRSADRSSGEASPGSDGGEVLVAAAGHVDHDRSLRRPPAAGDLVEARQGVGGFQRGHDAFQARAQLERGERLVVGRGQVADAARVRAARRAPARRRDSRDRR